MAPKKFKKTKEGQGKEYRLLSLEEMKTRENKYVARLTDLKACLQIIIDAEKEVKELRERKRLFEKWRNYVGCEGLPKPYIPPEIRLFFVKMHFFEEESIERIMNWLLSVDERSILSQNTFRKDLTKKTLVNEIRPNFGAEYAINVDLTLKVLKIINDYLDNPSMTTLTPLRILKDVVEQKITIQQEIGALFDRYAYRVLSSEDAYMETVNAITSDYCYEADHFKIHIWTLKNVPIRFEYMRKSCLMANLYKLKMKLQIPHSILEDNLTLRAIHSSFDHLSEHAKSFHQEITVPIENLSAGISDIYECLVHDWNVQIELQSQILEQMMGKRREYEEILRKIEEENEAKKRARKTAMKTEKESKKKPKGIKLPKEPPAVPIDSFPDIWDDFLEKERIEFQNFMNVVYHPDSLNLSPDEINLKKYLILGGVYQLYFVTKPTHYNFNDFNMTWHENNGKLVVKKDVFVAYEKPELQSLRSLASMPIATPSRMGRPSRMTVRASRIDTRKSRIASMSELETDPDEDVFEDSPFFKITLELPRYLCLFGEPLACYYESDVIGYAEMPEKLPPPPSLPASRPSTIKKEEETEIVMDYQKSAVRSMLLPIGSSVALAQSSRRVSTSIYSTTSNVFRRTSPQLYETAGLDVDDFFLDLPLNKIQIRNLQRHCLPRIISSFKFSHEIKDEVIEENRSKAKGKGGTLVRQKAVVEDLAVAAAEQHAFSIENQNNPERIFPFFPKSERLRKPMRFREKDVREGEAGTFFEIIDTLDAMKRLYKLKYEKITKLPHFKMAKKFDRKSSHLLSVSLPSRVEDKRKKKEDASARESKKSSRKSSRVMSRQGSFSKIDEVSQSALITKAVESISKVAKPEEIMSIARAVEEPELNSQAEQEEIAEEVDERLSYKYAHWTTKHIIDSVFDKETCTMTIFTDRLGNFGFAFKRYEHFPFRYWSVEPNEENPNEVIFTLETQFVKCVLFVTGDGYRGHVTEPTKKFVRKRMMYLTIPEPITDFKELKQLFREKNLNIFSEHDASFYIENGYFSEKHLAAELHTYACMAIHSGIMKFAFSDWNRLAKRREIILRFGLQKELDENLVLVRITPEEATFVEIKELCSDDLNVFRLHYTPTWRNIDFYADLHQLISSMHAGASEMRVKDPNLLYCLKNLLCEIRPLSYS